MPIDFAYTCDFCSKPINDTDIAADLTGATLRVMLDANLYHLTEAGTVSLKATGQHVFCSVAHATAWAEALTL